jgi:hypothetical protein
MSKLQKTERTDMDRELIEEYWITVIMQTVQRVDDEGKFF